jgi:DNA-binding CsgD family transcriptional regulator
MAGENGATPPERERGGRPDDAALLELVGDVVGMLDVQELRDGLLDALHRALPSDYISLNELGPGPDDVFAVIRPESSAELFEIWARLAHENPLLQRLQRTRDGRAYRFSDVIPYERLHELPIYRELYGPMGVEHQLAFTLPAGPDRVLAVALSRGDCDYSDEERDFANRARHFLIQAYLNAIAYDAVRAGEAPGAAPAGAPPAGPARPDGDKLLALLAAAGLTRREAEAMRLVALGRSNRDAAAALGISDRTVGKHLEHGFRKLGVSDRSTAAGRVWELAGVMPSSLPQDGDESG